MTALSIALAGCLASVVVALLLGAAIGRADHGEDTDDDWGAL